MNIGEKISEIRKSKKIKIETLSQLSGVPISTLKKILTGVTKDPQIDTIKAIAKALNCTLEDFDEQSNKNNYSTSERKLITDYRALDKYGKLTVDTIMDVELRRVNEQNVKNSDTDDEEYELIPVAARDGGITMHKMPKEIDEETLKNHPELREPPPEKPF